MNILSQYRKGDIADILARVEECHIDLSARGFDVIKNSDNRWWVRDTPPFLPKCTAAEVELELLNAVLALTDIPAERKILRIELGSTNTLQLSPQFLATLSAAGVHLELGAEQ